MTTKEKIIEEKDVDNLHFISEYGIIKKISTNQNEAKNHKDKKVRDKYFVWAFNALT